MRRKSYARMKVESWMRKTSYWIDRHRHIYAVENRGCTLDKPDDPYRLRAVVPVAATNRNAPKSASRFFDLLPKCKTARLFLRRLVHLVFNHSSDDSANLRNLLAPKLVGFDGDKVVVERKPYEVLQ